MNIQDQRVKDAFGALVLDALRHADDIKAGFVYDCPNLSIGGDEMGDWSVTVKRNSPPRKA